MIGETVSHYRITRQLGAGGMGVVYEAVDLNLKRTVALKFLPPELTRDDTAKLRFEHEAQAASALDHPNVCTIHEIGETEDGHLFIAMARYTGETLKEKVQRGPILLGEASGIARQIAEGLAKAHEQQIVHRDIKPANIFITDDGLVKILDFGLAKLSGQTQLTRTGTTLGTASYMSPEQARGEETGHQTDIWALGAVFYEMLTGVLPFPGERVHAQIYAILNTEPKPVADLVPSLPENVVLAIERALAKDPADRFASAPEFMACLGDSGAQAPGWRSGSASSVVRVQGSRAHVAVPRGLAIGAVLVLAVALIVGYFVWPRRQAGEFRAQNYLLVTDFEDRTETANLGNVLRTALTIDIQQSQYINVFSGNRLSEALARMEKPHGGPLTLDVGTELAIRESIPLVLTGSASSLGRQVIIAAQLVRPAAGDVVFATRVEAVDEAALLPALDELSQAIREHLGEPNSSIRSNDEPLAKVTTPSLAALRLYSDGDQAFLDGDWQQAILLLSQAVAADSTFAMAYAKLARIHFYSANTTDGMKYSAMAHDRLARLTLRERLYVEGEYNRYRGNYEQAIHSMTELLERYPDDTETRANLTATYLWAMDYKKALQNILVQGPGEAQTWQHYHALGNVYGFLGDYPAALAAFRQAQAVNPAPLRTQMCIAWCHICAGDDDAAAAALDTLAEMVGTGSVGSDYMVAKSLLALGRIEDALVHFGRARDDADLHARQGQLFWIDLYTGMAEDLRGNPEVALAAFRHADAIFPGEIALVHAAKILARIGDLQAADQIEAEFAEAAAASPDPGKRTALIKTRGYIAYERGDYARAVEVLSMLLPTRIDGFAARFELGRAQFEAGDLAGARSSFEFIVANRYTGFHEGVPYLWPLAEYNLGLVAEADGRPADARRHWEAFLRIWNQADSDLPSLRNAALKLGTDDRG